MVVVVVVIVVVVVVVGFSLVLYSYILVKIFQNKCTPLHLAARNGDDNIVQALFEHKPPLLELNLVSHEPFYSQTSLGICQHLKFQRFTVIVLLRLGARTCPRIFFEINIP